MTLPSGPRRRTLLLRRVASGLTWLGLLCAAVTTSSALHPVGTNLLLSRLTGAQSAAASGEAALRVTSELPPLSPGSRGRFEARVMNPSSAATTIRIATITAVVDDASPRCAASNVSIPAYTWSPSSPTYTVEPGHTVSVPMSISMLNTDGDQNGCQGVTFRVRYALTSRPV